MASCKSCGKSIGFLDSVGGYCPACHFNNQRQFVGEIDPVEQPVPKSVSDYIILSTEAAPDLSVTTRLDIISAEFAVGMGLLTDVFNAWRDVFGGRSKSYQNTLKDARKAVLRELRDEAHELGADAVLGVKLDYSEISGGGKSMLFLVASGTAVKLAATTTDA